MGFLSLSFNSLASELEFFGYNRINRFKARHSSDPGLRGFFQWYKSNYKKDCLLSSKDLFDMLGSIANIRQDYPVFKAILDKLFIKTRRPDWKAVLGSVLSCKWIEEMQQNDNRYGIFLWLFNENIPFTVHDRAFYTDTDSLTSILSKFNSNGKTKVITSRKTIDFLINLPSLKMLDKALQDHAFQANFFSHWDEIMAHANPNLIMRALIKLADLNFDVMSPDNFAALMKASLDENKVSQLEQLIHGLTLAKPMFDELLIDPYRRYEITRALNYMTLRGHSITPEAQERLLMSWEYEEYAKALVFIAENRITLSQNQVQDLQVSDDPLELVRAYHHLSQFSVCLDPDNPQRLDKILFEHENPLKLARAITTLKRMQKLDWPNVEKLANAADLDSELGKLREPPEVAIDALFKEGKEPKYAAARCPDSPKTPSPI